MTCLTGSIYLGRWTFPTKRKKVCLWCHTTTTVSYSSDPDARESLTSIERQRWEVPHVARIRQFRWQYVFRVPQGHFRLSLSRRRQNDDNSSTLADSREARSLGKSEEIHAVRLSERTCVGGNSEGYSKTLPRDISLLSRIQDRRQTSCI